MRPRRLDAWQTLIAQHNYPAACGYGLFIDNKGRLQWYLSDGHAYRPERVLHGPILKLAQWQHVVGAWDGKTKPTKIEAWSEAYFGLLKRGDKVAKYLALGEKLIVVLGEIPYEITPAPTK